MEHTWRWFGPDDPISLAEVRQTDATGIVSALHHIPNGEVWSVEEILKRKAVIEAAGLTWSVVESVPVHEHIKWGGPKRDEAIANYAQTLRNLGACGLKTVCYNFMPVIDWARTEQRYAMPNGGFAMRFDFNAHAAFDLFILERTGAEADYTPDEVAQARDYLDRASEAELTELRNTVLLGLPGSEESYELAGLRASLALYDGLTADDIRENLGTFLRAVVPAAEEAGIRLAIHPDDPPRPLFGLPRVVSNADDAQWLLDAAPSWANGLTMCVGSYGSVATNDVVEMTRRFADRIYFAHLRNVTIEADGKSFFEDDHIDGGSDMVGVITELVREEQRRAAAGEDAAVIPMRPDHGHFLLDDLARPTYPGYALIGRLKGLAELRGVERAVTQVLSGSLAGA
ncbi:mannonate dehydratase [Microbacterium terrae]|uniref:Mannonate dehydratase n=1 Tax=Microbacterium terrae TaxID=69369 RepID=A0A0M2HI93_9MICO|nr:mannonate dehydratase [Microbacterium terrae]KJL44505.1 Mannonate dehydratase [Microbacterium terrae]MBP1079492.1 mannonate dehydratase [Microbacterium terrae]GLJ96833.1 mannonate dehydratase [Microbacterium terrae]